MECASYLTYMGKIDSLLGLGNALMHTFSVYQFQNFADGETGIERGVVGVFEDVRSSWMVPEVI